MAKVIKKFGLLANESGILDDGKYYSLDDKEAKYLVELGEAEIIEDAKVLAKLKISETTCKISIPKKEDKKEDKPAS